MSANTGAAGALPVWRGGQKENKFGPRRVVLVFGGAFLALAAVTVVIGALAQPPAPKPVCPKGQVCTTPPPPARLPGAPAPRLSFNQSFTSSALGFRLEYPASVLTESGVTASGVTLAPPVSDPALMITVQGAPSSRANPKQMLQQRVAALHDSIPDLHLNSDPSRQILAPAVGGRAGVGGFYQGTFNSPSGLLAPADVAILAATDGRETIAVSVISANRAYTVDDFRYIDEHILATLRFKGDIPQ